MLGAYWAEAVIAWYDEISGMLPEVCGESRLKSPCRPTAQSSRAGVAWSGFAVAAGLLRTGWPAALVAELVLVPVLPAGRRTSREAPWTFAEFAIGSARPLSLPREATPTPHVSVVL